MKSKVIKEFIDKKNISIYQLSKLTNIDDGSLNRIINNITKNPRIDTVIKIAKALELSEHDFCKLCGYKTSWQEIKAEDLKAGIWVYDKKPDCEIFTFFKITKVLSKEDCKYLYGDENKKVFFDNMTDIAREYEAGRYFLVCKNL